MDNKEIKQIVDSIITIDNFIQKHLYELKPKTVSLWFDVKHDIDSIVIRKTGKSVYGQWDEK